MTPRLPVLKPREVLRALQKADFEINHQTGSHVQLRHPEKLHLRITVPRHDRFDLPIFVLNSISQVSRTYGRGIFRFLLSLPRFGLRLRN